MTAQAQTKEETIEWLKGEGASLLRLESKKYIASSERGYKVNLEKYTIESVNDSIIVIQEIVKEWDDTYERNAKRETDIRKDTIKFKALLYQEVPEPPEELRGDNYWSDLTKYYLMVPGGGKIVILADKTKPQNTLRVVKAINHMAKLCGAKPYKKLFE